MKMTPRRLRLLLPVLLVFGTLRTMPPTAHAQDTLVQTTIHRFAGPEGSSPTGLILGSAGNLSGTPNNGGVGYVAGQPTSGFGTVYRITPAGELIVLYSFTGGDDGKYPRSLIQGSDGNLYGVTLSGGAGNRGTVFRLTPAGALTTVLVQDSTKAAGTLLQGPDGNFYGFGISDRIFDNEALFHLTPAGEYTVLSTFASRSYVNSLVLAGDSNLYGTVDASGHGYGGIFRQRLDGTEEGLYTLSAADGLRPNGLTPGRDGNLYGTTQTQGSSGNGTAFRITPAGEFTVLYRFPEGSGNYPIYRLVLGRDGNFYGVTNGPGQYTSSDTSFGRSTVFRLTATGGFTPLYASAATVGEFVLGPDGNFYGTQSSPADEAGMIFKLTSVPHPAFFTGQVPLGNGVEYLAFPNGNVFGYYSFLSDPRSVYHFDLGYEYVFDALDGKSGVYLYDFRSGDFFYTSPTFPFPYLYDFGLNAVLYYFPDPNNAGHHNTNGTRYFYRFDTGEIITK